MVRCASCASLEPWATISFAAILRGAQGRAAQAEDFFLGALLSFSDAEFFLDTGLFVGVFLGAFFALRAFGRFLTAARWAAANAALAHPVSSSGSSKSRAGNCQYEFTVTVLARV
jgi:hypothetical protein